MSASIDALFQSLWTDYVGITPSAEKIHQLLGQGHEIINDHIALRTFNLPKVGLPKLASHFEALGYEAKGDYHFEQKRLKAKHFEHPDPTQPKVFISELLVEQFSQSLQDTVHSLVEQVDAQNVSEQAFLYSGTHWQVTSQEYEKLLAESEYAAWMSAWGYRANHFTVSVNALPGYSELQQVNDALKQAGFKLNESGGEIKGGPSVYLAQSSTMADKSAVQFVDEQRMIPSCFYEFAQRFSLPSGELYSGFVAASADKIFESTNAQ